MKVLHQIRNALGPTAIILWLGFGLIWPNSVLALPEAVSRLEKTPLPRIQVPKIYKKTLKNGMRVLMLPDDEMPVVRGYFFIRTGSIYDPPTKVGLADLTGSLLRAGGTKQYSSEKFNEVLDGLGAIIGSGMHREYGSLSFRALKEDWPRVAELVFQVLREPAFEEKKLNLIKFQMMEGIRRQNDSPTSIARREFPKLIYGPDNVWSRSASLASVKDLNRQDVLAFYQNYYHPDRMILAVSGDFSPDQMVKTLDKLSEGWAKAKTPLPKIPQVQKSFESGVYLAAKETDQSTVMMGHFGERRFNPDKYALILLNDILGGDVMSSRLGRKIRSTLGLAYGIYSQYGLATDYGMFIMFAQTKAVSTKQVMEEMKKILAQVATGQDLTQKELEEHQQSVVSSLYSQYEPRFNFVKDEARFEYLGYPPNYLQFFRKKIQGVTLADLQRVAKKYLKPDALKVLVVGDENKTGPISDAKRISLEIL